MTRTEFQQFLENSYTPAFFKMKVDVFEDLSDLNTLRTPIMSLYFHEYIHFIQDISTVYGLMGISNTTYYVRDAAATAIKTEQQRFDVPHEIKRRGDFGYNNHRTWEYYRGSSINPMRKSVTLISNPKEKIVKIDGQDLHYIQFLARDNESGKDFEFRFGGNILTEGMAYLCERIVFQRAFENEGMKYNLPKEYPYSICEKVVEKLYPELLNVPVIIVALCDLALLNYNPGFMFIELIKHFKEIKIFEQQDRPIKNVIDFITYFYEKGYEFLEGHQYDFALMQDVVLNEMKEYFKDACFQKNNEWLAIVFERVRKNRQAFPQFIIDILLCCDENGVKNNAIYKDFVNKVGSPMVLDGDDNCTYAPPEGFVFDDFSPSLFMAIHQMYLLFINSTKKLPCSLKEQCKKSKDTKIIVDDNCDIAPWKHALYPEGLCPYGAIWKHWGLLDKEPNI